MSSGLIAPSEKRHAWKCYSRFVEVKTLKKMKSLRDPARIEKSRDFPEIQMQLCKEMKMI